MSLPGFHSAVALVRDERERQRQKWGEQDHDWHRWCTILTEEVGEVAEAILSGNRANYKAEVTQVAAVAIAILEHIQRTEHAESVMREIIASNGDFSP